MQKDTIDREYILTFGKYKGSKLGDLLSENPSYLIWLHHNTKLHLTNELMSLAVLNVGRSIYRATDEHFSHDIYEYGDN